MFSEIFYSCQKKCPRGIRRKVAKGLEDPVASGCILVLVMGTLLLDIYCLYSVIPSLFRGSLPNPLLNVLLELLCHIGGWFMGGGILGHLYVLSKDQINLISRILQINNEPSYPLLKENYENQTLHHRRGYQMRGSGLGNPVGSDLGNEGKGDRRFKELGLILYLVVGSCSAFLLCFLNLVKTEGFAPGLLLLLKSMVFFLSFHLDSIVTSISGAIFIVTLLLLVGHLQVLMIRCRIDTSLSLSSLMACLTEIKGSKCLATIILPDLITAYNQKGSTLLPRP